MIRAVVDTNVYVSALVFGGVPALALQLAELGVFQVVASQEIHEELVATLTGKFGWTKDRSESACRNLWQEAHWVVPSQNVHASRDPDDDYILACALESQAAFVITGDNDLLALHPFRGVAIVTPAKFLVRVRREQERG
jgi:putative PIN family toxin of toxin-antitoxin system